MGLQRAPDSQVAKERRRVVKARQVARKMAASATMKFRRSGGYGKKFASCWEPPSMGIESSPAYRFVVSRCGIDPLPEPEDRDGAPVKGGLPFNQYPPNLLVDGQRAYWLPDDWAQVVKNTGPGGTYVGWLNPGGKFFYHRHGYPTAIEESLGRVLTAVDGFNGIMRSVGKVVTEQGDKDFLETCLTSKERRNIVPVRKFHFAVISARRATSPDGIHNIMVVEAHFRLKGVRPTWYVDEARGAVAIRDSAGAKEKLNISILMKKWPGAFCLNGRRKHEVVLSWKRCKTDPCRAQSTTKTFEEHKCLKLSGASKLGKGKSVKPIKHLKSNGHTGQMRQTHLKQRSLRCRAVVKR
ncbi:unnamed protein product [Durusdinium trenchii]|uniref:Uncharacterized protein n=1 Tax=Durusdinium trenchii TaxID=1381693 RepID=A0ABP0MYR0_9DINO